MASLAAVEAQPIQAARLFGAALELRDSIGVPLPRVERVTFERYLTLARERMSPEAWEAALADGRAQPLDELLEDGLALLAPGM
jgi:hypothetical protein